MARGRLGPCRHWFFVGIGPIETTVQSLCLPVVFWWRPCNMFLTSSHLWYMQRSSVYQARTEEDQWRTRSRFSSSVMRSCRHLCAFFCLSILFSARGGLVYPLDTAGRFTSLCQLMQRWYINCVMDLALCPLHRHISLHSWLLRGEGTDAERLWSIHSGDLCIGASASRRCRDGGRSELSVW